MHILDLASVVGFATVARSFLSSADERRANMTHNEIMEVNSYVFFDIVLERATSFCSYDRARGGRRESVLRSTVMSYLRDHFMRNTGLISQGEKKGQQ